MTHGYNTHDSCPECGSDRMTSSVYTSAGGGERVKTGKCIKCGKAYVTDV